METKDISWYTTWFDSPYYHILYKDRDTEEAKQFLDKLLTYLHPKPHYTILDLACGKGRHSIYLNSQGFDVTGIDLSEHNIEAAKKHENEHLHFEVHDMRETFREEAFDFVLNLFTSFGYFEEETDNIIALRAASQSTKHGGKIVIDFMNTGYALKNLVANEQKEIDGVQFGITRKLQNGFIVKHITIQDGGRQHTFEERVRALSYDDFIEYFRMADLRLADVFGSYSLEPFNPETSERMIFVLKKY
ncbi:MAG: class I SAM-dependent methyltransferase [Sphingobacteriales bacterium]|nr:MAG: class I SAM-dependent methyltransferase [Sphingobacteriales bacterium]